MSATGASTASGSWNDGYVVDVAYTEPTFPSICPAHVSMSAVLHGQPPLPSDRRLTWVDLGSGGGLPACMVAAANPDIDVWGCDFNPSHVERARSLAARAGLDNCTFDEAPFAEVARDDRLGPEAADVIVVNGVYSWISRANQVHIGEIVRRMLRPGGLVFVSHSVPTGWAAMTPIAEALHLRAASDGRRSDLAFPAAAAEMLALAEHGGRYFPLPRFEAPAFAELRTANARYSAHEYLGAHFRPLMFPEVAEVMAIGRCTYLGSLEATGSLWRLGSTPELVDLVASTPDTGVREVLRDLIAQRPLRRDLYRRGMATPTVMQRQRWAGELEVIGLDQAADAVRSVPVPLGSVNLDRAFYEPLVDRLREQRLRVRDVLELHPELAFGDATGSLAVLVSGGWAAPTVAREPDDAVVARTRRLNQLLIEENRQGGDHRSLVSPATGAPISSEYVEMLAVGAVWDGLAPEVGVLVDHAVAELARQGRVVREGGELVHHPDDARTIIERRVRRALERMDGIFRAHRIT